MQREASEWTISDFVNEVQRQNQIHVLQIMHKLHNLLQKLKKSL